MSMSDDFDGRERDAYGDIKWSSMRLTGWMCLTVEVKRRGIGVNTGEGKETEKRT